MKQNTLHTPEPLRCTQHGDSFSIWSEGWGPVASTQGDCLKGAESKATGERLVACYNACAGMVDPEATIRALVEALEGARKHVAYSYSSGVMDAEDAGIALDAALAKVKPPKPVDPVQLSDEDRHMIEVMKSPEFKAWEAKEKAAKAEGRTK